MATKALYILGKFNFYTVPIQTREVKSIYATCFSGLSLQGCQMPEADDLIYLNQIPYQQTFNGLGMQPYCLQCCGTPIDYTDTWDMYCPLNSASLINYCNVYGYELRLATNRFVGDTDYVKCPLRRSACSYDDAGNTLGCNRVGDKTWLVGYTATLWVEQFDEAFTYWRGVSRCEIESIESNVSIEIDGNFHEKIVMIHEPLSKPQLDGSKIFIFIVFFIFVIYIFLYLCRRKRCCYCQQKLVVSMSLCLKCQFVGAEPPDPVLMKALEDKGLHLQGEFPERFPGAKCLSSCSLRVSLFVCSLFGRKPKSRIKIVPVTGVDNFIEISSVPDTLKQTAEATLDDESKSAKDVKDSLNALEAGVNGNLQNEASSKASSKKSKRKKENPNELKYEPHMIFEAVQHPLAKPVGAKKKKDIPELPTKFYH